MSELLNLLTILYLSKSLNVLIIWYVLVQPSTRPKRETKSNSLLDDELEFLESNS